MQVPGNEDLQQTCLPEKKFMIGFFLDRVQWGVEENTNSDIIKVCHGQGGAWGMTEWLDDQDDILGVYYTLVHCFFTKVILRYRYMCPPTAHEVLKRQDIKI